MQTGIYLKFRLSAEIPADVTQEYPLAEERSYEEILYSQVDIGKFCRYNNGRRNLKIQSKEPKTVKKILNWKRLLQALGIGLIITLAFALLLAGRYEAALLLWVDALSVAGIGLLLAGLWLLALNLGAFSSTVYSFRRTRQVLSKKQPQDPEKPKKQVPDSYAEYDAQRNRSRKVWEPLLAGGLYLGIGLLLSCLL